MRNFDWSAENTTTAFVDANYSFKQSSVKFSNLLSINGHFVSPSIGIKYVIEGSENYIFSNTKHQVKSEQYLLINAGQDFECCFNEKKTVKGACISISNSLLQDAHNYITQSEESLLDDPSHFYAYNPELFETVYPQSNIFSHFLKRSIQMLGQDDYDQQSFYQNIAIELLVSQKLTLSEIVKIKASKISTKKELYRRLHVAKEIIDSSPAIKINIPDLARESALSEFHFLRCFKLAFGLSPHQYIINKRLILARNLLETTEESITNIAYLAGFTDIFSFSKSFKKCFRETPSNILKSPKITYD